MSERCEQVKQQFPLAFYQELDSEERARFEAHLRQCPACSREFEALKSTLQLMNERRRPQLPGVFWERLEEGIEGRIRQQELLDRQRKRSRNRAYRIAAGIILVLLGVGIDRVILHRSQPVDSTLPVVTTSGNLESQTAQYLGRSQLLLLALANVDTLAEGAENIDLSVQKQVSRELFEEAPKLAESLRKKGHYRLESLVNDLEKVLLQVANLDERRGLRQVRLIQKSIRQSDLLLRVNLQKLRPSLGRKNRQESVRVMG